MKTLKQVAELLPAAIQHPESANAMARLVEWESMAEGAYAKNTRRAQRADGAIFQAFCERAGVGYFPAEPKTIRAFIEHCVKQSKNPRRFGGMRRPSRARISPRVF